MSQEVLRNPWRLADLADNCPPVAAIGGILGASLAVCLPRGEYGGAIHWRPPPGRHVLAVFAGNGLHWPPILTLLADNGRQLAAMSASRQGSHKQLAVRHA
jgi:hypothetical protein